MGIKVANGYRFLRLGFRFYLLHHRFTSLFVREIWPLFAEMMDFLPDEQARHLRYRVKNYTTILAPFFGSLLFRLHRLKPNKQQRRLLAMVGAATAFFDLIYDENWAQGQKITFPPSPGSDPIGRLVFRLYQLIMKDAPMQQPLLHWINYISQIEQESCSQKSLLTQAEIEEITFRKGGAGLMVFRLLVPVEITYPEEQALMKVGALIQLMDDMADVWQDIQERITTPASFYPTPALLADHIENKFSEMTEALMQAGFSARVVNDFCFSLYAAFLVGKMHAYRLTDYMRRKQKSLSQLTKPEVILRPGLIFWYAYVGQLLRFTCSY
ncbi:MAG: hypothetical protein ACP5O2_00540 [Bacteroidales bacterium]